MKRIAVGSPFSVPLLLCVLGAGVISAAATRWSAALQASAGTMLKAGLVQAVLVLLGLLAGSGLLYGIGIVLEEGREFRYRQLLAVSCYAYIVVTVGEAVRLGLVVTGHAGTLPGPAMFASPGLLNAFLQQFDLFRVAALTLVTAGFREVTGFSVAKAGLIICALWLLQAASTITVLNLWAPLN